MKQEESKQQLPVPSERVKLAKPMGRHLFRLLSFLVCVAVLVAAFAVSGIWTSFGEPVKTFFEGVFRRERETEPFGQSNGETSLGSEPQEDKDQPKETQENTVSIISKALYEAGQAEMPSEDAIHFAKSPLVFIYCSNPKEAYWRGEGAITVDKIGEATFSENSDQTVCAVAKKLQDTLKENGISAIYGEPEAGDGYLGSSERAKKLIQQALIEYPEIAVVIEIGRDSLFDSEGNYIKPVTEDTTDPIAQVLAVVGVGTSESRTSFWQKNLQFAKALQAAAEEQTPGIFRGIRLKSTPQNQQYAPFSLSLLIGSGATTVEEAQFSAQQIGASLSSVFSIS